MQSTIIKKIKYFLSMHYNTFCLICIFMIVFNSVIIIYDIFSNRNYFIFLLTSIFTIIFFFILKFCDTSCKDELYASIDSWKEKLKEFTDNNYIENELTTSFNYAIKKHVPFNKFEKTKYFLDKTDVTQECITILKFNNELCHMEFDFISSTPNFKAADKIYKIVCDASINIFNQKKLNYLLKQLIEVKRSLHYRVTYSNEPNNEHINSNFDFDTKTLQMSTIDELLNEIKRFKYAENYHTVFDEFIENLEKLKHVSKSNELEKYNLVFKNLIGILAIPEKTDLINENIIPFIKKLNKKISLFLNNIHTAKTQKEDDEIKSSIDALDHFLTMNGL